MGVLQLILPRDYHSQLDIRQTEVAIKLTKDTFEAELAKRLNLTRVSAPLFVQKSTGINDDLNGVERPVGFDILETKSDVEIVHSLAKWKRMALKRYGFKVGEGLYTDMNAIRRDEELDNLHSVYVDQWDWEKVISREQRNTDLLYETVEKIVDALKATSARLTKEFTVLPDLFKDKKVHFVSSQELEDKYPTLTPKEREDAVCKEYGVVFITQIGKRLNSGMPHDGRAPDYDDWNLNGDILVWYPVLNRAVEISSMGIRVDAMSLAQQLKESECEQRRELPFHKMLLNNELPLTMGGGIGQSRICMLMLSKAHIGEVQSSAWSNDMIKICEKNNITLL